MLIAAARLGLGESVAAAVATAVVWKKVRRFIRLDRGQELNAELAVVLLTLVNVCFFAKAICNEGLAYVFLGDTDNV
jgi:hypothetical protein